MVKRVPLKDAFSDPESPLYCLSMKNRVLLMRQDDYRWDGSLMTCYSLVDVGDLRLLGVKWYRPDGRTIDYDFSYIIVADKDDKYFPYSLYYSLTKEDN